jgi:hypothetical protein
VATAEYVSKRKDLEVSSPVVWGDISSKMSIRNMGRYSRFTSQLSA